MAEFFSSNCGFCGAHTFFADQTDDSDEVKMSRFECPRCDSPNLRTEPMDEAFYRKHPDVPRFKEGASLLPLRVLEEPN